MTPDVWEYFHEMYEKCGFRVVPGHWPDFKDKEHVDRWIALIQSMGEETEAVLGGVADANQRAD